MAKKETNISAIIDTPEALEDRCDERSTETFRHLYTGAGR